MRARLVTPITSNARQQTMMKYGLRISSVQLQVEQLQLDTRIVLWQLVVGVEKHL
jgi:hypothetical protein